MSSKIKKLSLFLSKLGLSKEAEEIIVLSDLDEDELPTRFPIAFRYWIRDVYYKNYIDARFSPKWKGITANSLFKKEPESTKRKIYEAWKLIVDARNDKEEEQVEPPPYVGEEGAQLELFGGFKPDMIKKMQKLSSWLLENRLQEEAFSALDLMKLAAGKPMPINEAEVQSTVDELLTELHAKFLAYPQLSPFELYGVLARRFSLDDAKIPPIIDDPTDEQALEIEAVRQIYEANLPRNLQIESLKSLVKDLKEINPELYKNLTAEYLEEQYVDSQEQYLVNYLASNITKKKKDIKGDDVTVTYRLLFSHVSERPPGATMYGADSSEKDVIIGFNPNGALIAVVQDYMNANGEAFDAAIGNIPAEIEFFKKSIRPYLVSVLTHEEVHVVDVISKDPKQGEVYKISDPNGETLEEIAKKLEIEAQSLFIVNLMEVVNEASTYIDPMVIMSAITELVSGEAGAAESIFNQVKSQKLKKDFELRIPPRSHSQIRVDKLRGIGSEFRSEERVRTRSLQEIADETGLKHGVMRLIVVNFNNVFAGSLRMNGEVVGMAPSYQDIYELMQTRPEVMQDLANAKLPEGTEVKLVPSYSELYAYDRGFYLLTKEEGKAFTRQIMSDIKHEIEKDDNLTIEKVQEMSVQDMMKISSQAMEVEAHLQINPVDEILKTPIGYMDKLKKQRLKLFYSAMHHVHAMLGNEESSGSSATIS